MMERLNVILKEAGISKVKLAKYLGVSRQMIYNYLEVEDINKWPKDKKVLLLNLLNIKSADEIFDIEVDTDYISSIESRLNPVLMLKSSIKEEESSSSISCDGLGKKEKELMHNIMDIVKDYLEDGENSSGFFAMKYLYNFLQSMGTSRELKYMLGYVAKETCFEKPNVFAFDEDEQYIFESIMFTAMTLYNNGGTSKSRISVAHERFEEKIKRKVDETLGRTMELNRLRLQAMQELGYTSFNDSNVVEISSKMAEIESRKINN